MPKSLPDISYITEKDNHVIDSDNSLYNIPFYKPTEYFSSIEVYSKFINSVEKMVRMSPRYKKYIDYLKKDIHLDHCQVLSELTDDDCEIEMHHGPIFTLYDYCSIVLEYFIVHKKKITSFRVANVVLDEHFKNRVQVVMLSATIHQEVHEREIFINYKQGWGDLNAFIKEYADVIPRSIKEKFNRYLDRCLAEDSSDYGILELSKKIGL